MLLKTEIQMISKIVKKRSTFISEILDKSVDFSVPIDIFAIGFEEMVDLSASNIVSTR